MTSPSSDESKSIVSPEIEQLQQQVAEMEVNWKRALADYQNLQKRVQQQQQHLAQLTCLQLVERMLPVLDNLERAMSHINDPGLEMVAKQFQDVLEAEGVVKITAINQEFDPNLMECIDQVPGQHNQVVQVVAQGYQAGSKIIRPAKVVVGNGQNTNK